MCVLSVIHMLLPAAIWSSQCHTGAGGFLLCVGTHLYCVYVCSHPDRPPWRALAALAAKPIQKPR